MQRKQIINLVIIILTVLVIQNPAGGQIPSNQTPFTESKPMFASPLFLYDAYYFRSQEDKTNFTLHIYISIANDILQFIKERQGNYTAGYDLFISIYNHRGNIAAEKLVSNKLTVNTFEETNNREMNNNHHLTFDLTPDKYKIVLDLTDHDTQKSNRREKEIEIKAIEDDEISFSEIVFANYVVFDSLNAIKEIIPSLTRNFINPDSSFWIYFETYPIASSEDLKIQYTLVDASDQAIFRKEQQLTPDKKMVPFLLDISKEIKTPGRFTFIIQAEQRSKKATKKAIFSANWSKFEFSKLNVQTAIEPLKELSLIPADDLDFLKNASDSAKEIWFKDFWKQRDQTPDSEVNEVFEIFYRRVDFANMHFTVNAMDKQGWQTDRGQIYCKYGPPSNIERHLDEINQPPHEIWYYENLQKRFVFRDKSGFGDFQLVRVE